MKTNILAQFRKRIGGINSMSPHDIAEQVGIKYTGDVNLEHGGIFYDVADWKQNGHCNAVKVSIDDGCVWIQSGTVDRLDNPAEFAECLANYGFSMDDDNNIVNEQSGEIVSASGDDNRTCVEIEVIESYWGIEGDTDCFKLHEQYSGNGSDYFVANGRNIKLDDLQGFVLSQYVVPNLEIEQ
jgi:hypothetical protein